MTGTATADSITVDAARPARVPLPVRACALLAVLAACWFAANLHAPRGSALLGWLPAPLALTLASLAQWRAGSTPGLPAAARRFWHQFGLAGSMVALGVGLQAWDALANRRPRAVSQEIPLAVLLIFLAAILVALWALLRIPVGARSRGQWLRLGLDAATVMLGAALFIWYFAFSPLQATRSAGTFWASLLTAVLALVSVAAIAKVVLAGAGPVDIGALRLLALALLIGGLSASVTALLADRPPHLATSQIVVPMIAVVNALAGERQRQAATGGGRANRSPSGEQRPYSLLPYGAVAATDGLLLLVTLKPSDGRGLVVVAGAITLTGLVVVRQLAAFSDNARLLRRLRQHEQQLRHQASHDALTELANRALFGERVQAALAARPDGGLAVLLIDLDDFKTVNDTLGHAVGDGVLVAVAERLRHCVRPEDVVARLGGDEFAVLLERMRSDAVVEVAERILASLTKPVLAHGHKLLIQASIGVSLGPSGDDPGELLRNADIAMYAAKERGKGDYACYTPGMDAGILKHAQLGAELRQALDSEQFNVLYQPVVRLPDGRVVGAEALVRWRHPIRGLVPPAEFIPTAERTGLIVPLGRSVLREACHQAAAWRRAHGHGAPETVSVNIAARQLQEPGFVAEVTAALCDAGLEPRHLVVEATETAVLQGGAVVEALQALHHLGVRLALDDFGTGHSSLDLLRTCPVDILKLDKSFVDGVTGAARQAAVAAAVAQMAQALGLDAVAEGIETQAQAERLWQLGYRLGQGFHFATPLLPRDLDGLLAAAGRDRAMIPGPTA